MSDSISTIRARSEKSNRAVEKAMQSLPEITPRHKVQLARAILREVIAGGIDYGDFESAQAAGRDIRKAARVLDWI